MSGQNIDEKRIELAVQNFLNSLFDGDEIEPYDIQRLIDEVRESMDIDAVYIFEGLSTNSGFEITYDSCNDTSKSIKGMVRHQSVADYRTARMRYDDESITVYRTDEKFGDGVVMSYGMFHNTDYDGSLSFVKFRGKDVKWTAEERYYVKKLGRLLHREVLLSRSEKIEKERLKQQKELEKALDEAKNANNTKSQFLLNMSHDIRTPMGAIMGFADIILNNLDDTGKVESSAKKIKLAGDVLLKLINDVLDYARMEKGKVELESEVTHISVFEKTIRLMFESSMKDAGIDFTIESHAENLFVICDAMRCKQICINVISNAQKFTPKGGKVKCSLMQTSKPTRGYAQYTLCVEDTGIGISEEFQKHMFGEFERENNSTASKTQGTGIGLAIVSRLVNMMNGEINVESKVGEGTKITISIMMKLADEESLRSVETSRAERFDFSGRRVLIVEDNELNCEIAEEILKTYGFETDTADDGSTALDKISSSAPGYYDAVLMDVQMPRMDGYTATRRIRELENPALAAIPIVAITANAFDEDRQKAIEAGMNGHVAKPINTAEMLLTLKTVMPKDIGSD